MLSGVVGAVERMCCGSLRSAGSDEGVRLLRAAYELEFGFVAVPASLLSSARDLRSAARMLTRTGRSASADPERVKRARTGTTDGRRARGGRMALPDKLVLRLAAWRAPKCVDDEQLRSIGKMKAKLLSPSAALDRQEISFSTAMPFSIELRAQLTNVPALGEVGVELSFADGSVACERLPCAAFETDELSGTHHVSHKLPLYQQSAWSGASTLRIALVRLHGLDPEDASAEYTSQLLVGGRGFQSACSRPGGAGLSAVALHEPRVILIRPSNGGATK